MAHARLAASAAHRWVRCPASLKLCEEFKKEHPWSNKSTPYAELGHQAHDAAEAILTDAIYGTKYAEGLDITGEMLGHVELYVEHILQRDVTPSNSFIEHVVRFDDYAPDAYGTADFIGVEANRNVMIVDFKYGVGVKVDAHHNEQLMLYALGFYQTYQDFYDMQSFELTVVQPRIDWISTSTISLRDLLKFGDDVKRAAAEALGDNASFNPGQKQCKFCVAKPLCPAMRALTLESAKKDFDKLGNDITYLSDDDIATVLANRRLITGWLNAVESYAHAKLHHGGEIPGYKLVNGRSTRKWRDEMDAHIYLSQKFGEDVAAPRKLISPTQAEKLLGKDTDFLNENVVKPEGKPTLVPESDKREALKLGPQYDFNDDYND